MDFNTELIDALRFRLYTYTQGIRFFTRFTLFQILVHDLGFKGIEYKVWARSPSKEELDYILEITKNNLQRRESLFFLAHVKLTPSED